MNLFEVSQQTWIQALGDLRLGVFLCYCVQYADEEGCVRLTTRQLEGLLSTSRNTFKRWIDTLAGLNLMSLTAQNGSSTDIQLDLEQLETLLKSPQNGEVGPQSGEVPPQNGEISPQSREVAQIENTVSRDIDITTSTPTEDTTSTLTVDSTSTPPVDSDIGSEDSKKSEEEELKEESLPPIEKKKKKKSPKSEKPKFYDHEFYDEKYDRKAMALACTELKFPPGESKGTALLGAYLRGLQKKHGIYFRISGDEFGKIRGGGGKCCAFFTDECDGNEIEGFNMALSYVRWFILQEQGSYIANRAYPLSMLFRTESYREFVHAPKKKQKKTRWQQQNNSGKASFSKEDRKAASTEVM